MSSYQQPGTDSNMLLDEMPLAFQNDNFAISSQSVPFANQQQQIPQQFQTPQHQQLQQQIPSLNNTPQNGQSKIKIKMTATTASSQQIKQLTFDDCMTIINLLLQHEETWIFRDPVDRSMVKKEKEGKEK